MSIKEKIIQHKEKILAGAAIIGIVGVAVITKNKRRVIMSKDLPIPKGMVGEWIEYYTRSGKDRFAVINDVPLDVFEQLAKDLASTGFSESVCMCVCSNDWGLEVTK